MTEAQVLAILSENGWTKVQYKEVPSNDEISGGKVKHWMIRCLKENGLATLGKNFALYQFPDDSFSWQDRDPFPAAVVPSKFETDLTSFMASAISGGTVLRETSRKVDVTREQAIVGVILPDSADVSEARFLVYRNGETLAYKPFAEVSTPAVSPAL